MSIALTAATTSTLTIGKSTATTGALSLAGATSGNAIITVPASAGTPTFTLPPGTGLAGQRLVTDGSGILSWGGWAELKVAGSDFTTTTQALSDITGLITPTLATGTLYEFEAVLYCVASADANGNKFGVNVTGTGSPSASALYTSTTNSISNVTVIATSALTTAETTGYGAASGVIFPVIIKGFFVTGTGSPVFSIQGLKVTSGTLTVKIGSVLRYRPM
jgi:hypothetical protein